MPRTLLPDDEIDRILRRIAVEFMDSDTLPAAFLALGLADLADNQQATDRATRDLRALLGLTYLQPHNDDDEAVVYRLCANCHSLHRVPGGCTETR
jgi:hypothetical protein